MDDALQKRRQSERQPLQPRKKGKKARTKEEQASWRRQHRKAKKHHVKATLEAVRFTTSAPDAAAKRGKRALTKEKNKNKAARNAEALEIAQSDATRQEKRQAVGKKKDRAVKSQEKARKKMRRKKFNPEEHTWGR